MSVSASLDISIVKNERYPFCAKDLLSQMMRKNWGVMHQGKVCYLPLGDTLFEWTEKRISQSKLMEMIEQKEQDNEIIGLMLYWKNTDIGISMLIFPDAKIIFQFMSNRVKLENAFYFDMTDVNWYLERILCCFDRFQIEDICFHQAW